MQTEKIACIQCGALILPETANKNEGLCILCKRGTRASIEASKARYTEERDLEKTDPHQLLWKKLVDQIQYAEDTLTDAQRKYLAVGLLNGEVYNGGFDQFFFNSSGSYYDSAVQCLHEIGAFESLTLLQRAKQVLFNFDQVPTDVARRRAILRSDVSDSTQNRLEVLDKQFWTDPDGLATRLDDFARKNGLI